MPNTRSNSGPRPLLQRAPAEADARRQRLWSLTTVDCGGRSREIGSTRGTRSRAGPFSPIGLRTAVRAVISTRSGTPCWSLPRRRAASRTMATSSACATPRRSISRRTTHPPGCSSTVGRSTRLVRHSLTHDATTEPSSYDLGYAKKVSVDQPSLWVAQRNTPGLRIQVLDVTMSCRVHDSFSQCGRFSARPANFVTEHTRRAKNCVLIHGHNLSAAPAQRPHRSGQVSPVG